MIKVYRAQIRDMPHVVRLDNQTQEFALNVDEAKKWFHASGSLPLLAKIGGREVGFALAKFSESKDKALIDRVGTHSKFRRVGISRRLIERIALEVATENSGKENSGEVNIIVPSYLVDDNEDPWNIEQWLWKLGFKATTVLSNHFHRYNQDYDGYIFQRMKP